MVVILLALFLGLAVVLAAQIRAVVVAALVAPEGLGVRWVRGDVVQVERCPDDA